MARTITLNMSEQAFEVIQRKAAESGLAPADFVMTALERDFHFAEEFVTKKKVYTEEEAEAKARFESHFGTIVPDSPNCLDNDVIDADLAREYDSDHE